MTSNTFSKHDQDFADAMATKLRFNREKLKQAQTVDEKSINLHQNKENRLVNSGYQSFVRV